MFANLWCVLHAIRAAVPGFVFVFIVLPLSLLSLVSASFAIDAMVDVPSWLSIAIAMLIMFLVPLLHVVLAIAGIFYWP